MKLKALTAVIMSLFVTAAFAQSSGTGAGSANSSAPTNSGTDANQGPGSGAAPSNAPTTSTPSTASSSFEALDKNGDGYISKSEAKKDRVANKHWKQFDADKDGKLSRSEYDAGAAGAGSTGTSGSGYSK